MVRAVLVGCGVDEQGVARSRSPDRGRRHRRSRRYRPVPRAEARAKEFGLDGVAVGSDLNDDPRKDQAGCRVRRRRACGAARSGARRVRSRLPPPDRKAARRQPRARARRSSQRRGAPSGFTPSCRTAATWRMSGASGAFSIPARSARRPASTPISSSPRISAGSARRWTTSFSSTWRSTHSTRRATW